MALSITNINKPKTTASLALKKAIGARLPRFDKAIQAKHPIYFHLLNFK